MSTNIQALRRQIQELNHELDQLQRNLRKGVSWLQKAEAVIFGIFGLLRRLGLPTPIDAAIAKIQRMIAAIHMLHTASMMMMAGTPYGWVMGGIGVVGTLVTLADVR